MRPGDSASIRPVRYRFGDFVLSPARRVLMDGGRVVPLIPRYFDLLVLLVEQRERAVGKQEIFDRVWTDVVVSESALTQAVRTVRLALGDDPREPRFLRTVSRRGYQFVFAPVEAEPDSGPLPVELDPRRIEAPAAAAAAGAAASESAPQANRSPAPRASVLRQALTLASVRGTAAGLGGAAAGVVGGLCGGAALRIVSDNRIDAQVVLSLALVGALAGALGGAGVGTGLAAADALARSARTVALAIGGALTGLAAGWLAHHAARAVLSGLFGHDIPAMGGPLEGLVLGAAAGLGYGLATVRHARATAAPRGRARWSAAGVTGLATAIGAVALALAERHLVAASLDLLASTFAGSQVGLEPLARLLGEGGLRPVTRIVVSGFEGLLLGAGIALGLTFRPRQAAEPWPQRLSIFRR
jgi:DNA-binding winged helix-turn-helix (wHTH) protein